MDEIKATFRETPNTVIWFHCASLGEFEQGRPLMEAIKKKQPSKKIVLTFFSPSGYEIRKNYQGVDYVYYLPLDTRQNAQQVLQILQPAFAIFVKYEFWYHYLKTLQERQIPTYLIAGIFRPTQVFFQWYGRWYLNLLSYFTHLFVQEAASKDLLIAHGISKVSIAGDPRIDRVFAIASTLRSFPIIEAFKSQRPLFVAGSTHLKDILVLLPFIQQNTFWKILIVPHEVDAASIEQLQLQLPDNTLCYSDIQEATNLRDVPIMIVNTIGMLNELYQYAQVVYIGGGFDTGIHNLLEPAVFNVPLLIGPTYEKFEEAKAMVQKGGTFVIKDQEAIIQTLEPLENAALRQRAGQLNKTFLDENRGGTELIYNVLMAMP